MIWESDKARLALLELVASGKLRKRQAQLQAFQALEDLSWTCATGRRNEIGVVETRRSDLTNLIDHMWPIWREVLADLVSAGLPVTPNGYSELCDRRRLGGVSVLPERLNRRTAAAITAMHSKLTLTDTRREALKGVELTHDGVVRLRPPSTGLVASTNAGLVDLGVIASVLGEVSIPERAFLNGVSFDGEISALLLVENLGAWRDLEVPHGWMVAHVPGWDTSTVGHLLDRLQHIPVVHFGDLDPNGIRIFLHLRRRAPKIRWFLPDFWFELIDSAGLRTEWPEELDLTFAPAKVQMLASRGLWLEQERIVVDPRMIKALEEVVSG